MNFRVIASMLGALCSLASPVQGSTNPDIIELQGALQVIWADPWPESGNSPEILYFLVNKDFGSVALKINERLLGRIPNLHEWGGSKVVVQLRSIPQDDFDPQDIAPLDVESIRLDPARQPKIKGPSKSIVQGAPETQNQIWVTILCKFADYPDEPKTIDFFVDLFGNEDRGLDHFWRELSGDRISLENGIFLDWVTMDGVRSDYLLDNSQTYSIGKLQNDCFAAGSEIHDFSNATEDGIYGFNFVFNAGFGNWGLAARYSADIDGTYRAWPAIFTDATSPVDESLLAHEMGHAFGLPHVDNGDQDRNPYDNPWDVMSNIRSYSKRSGLGYLGKHTNAYHKAKLGWFSESEVHWVTDSSIVHLTVDATEVNDSQNYRAVVIPEYGTANYYTVETRMRIGEYDSMLPGDAVLIHKVDFDRGYTGPSNSISWAIDTDEPPSNNGDNEGTMFRVGETFHSPAGDFSVRIDSLSGEGFNVTIDSRNLSFAIPCSQESIVLATQSDIDSFQENYGPCDAVEGDLDIVVPYGSDFDDIFDLKGLAGLKFVYGTLTVRNLANLISVEGMQDLIRVGHLVMSGNDALMQLDALSDLGEVLELEVNGNDSLQTLSGLEGIQGIRGDISVQGNPVLADCTALSRLLDWRDDFDDGPGPQAGSKIPDVGRYKWIDHNAEGCNSAEEIAPPPSMASALVGSWYDPSESGTGFMVHAVTESLAVAYYYGFDSLGNRAWLIGVHEGPLSWGDSVEFDASYVTGGNFENFQAGQISEGDWGEMNFYFDDCEFGVMELLGKFPTSEASLAKLAGTQRLAPVAGFHCTEPYVGHPTDGLTGSWYDAETSGQGFAVHKVDESTGVVYYYGFDKDSQPLWLIGVWDEGMSFGVPTSLQVHQVSGGKFEYTDPDLIVEEPWGTLNIRFDGCTTGWARLSGEDGIQEFDLTLLAGSEGFACND